jgi:glycosyltransferase involved in cell wall biosynthesis
MPSIAELLWRAARRAGGFDATFRRVSEIARSEGIRGLLRRFHRTVRQEARYGDWIQHFDDKPEADRAAYERQLTALGTRPLFSIIMPVFDTPPELLEAAILSVRSQIYPYWELCICDDGSRSGHIVEILERVAGRESRLKWTRSAQNENISAASNAALALATGDWIIPFDHDDMLRPHALLEVALAITRTPQARFVYSDEDKIDETGTKRFDPHFKPDWSPDLLRSYNYISHLSAMRTEDVRAAGGWALGREGAQDHDLYLKITERLRRDEIVHISKILYHWRVVATSTASSGIVKPHALKAMELAVADHLGRTGRQADIVLLDVAQMVQLQYRLSTPPPLASIIIPNKDKPELIRACIESIRKKTDYPSYEFVVVDNGSTDTETLRLYEELQADGMRIENYPSEFNYSAMNNIGISAAKGEVLVFLNNDTAVIGSRWLSELVTHAMRPEVGCVGAKLYYDDCTIQHAGVFVGVCGVASHPYRGFDKADFGYFGRLRVAQNLSAVTAACLAVRRSVALEVRGFDERELKVALNDVDFCLKVREAGYENVWTPFAELYHFESKSRGYEVGEEKRARFQREIEVFSARWSNYIEADPFYSPHLTRTSESVTIRSE